MDYDWLPMIANHIKWLNCNWLPRPASSLVHLIRNNRLLVGSFFWVWLHEASHWRFLMAVRDVFAVADRLAWQGSVSRGDVLVECLHEPVLEGCALEGGAAGVEEALGCWAGSFELADQIDGQRVVYGSFGNVCAGLELVRCFHFVILFKVFVSYDDSKELSVLSICTG